MRNTIGHYIDLLSDEERDRIVTATEWRPGCIGRPGEPRCLVGHAEAPGVDEVGGLCMAMVDCAYDRFPARPLRRFSAATRFDHLVARVGLERAVRLVKVRAAAVSSREVEAQEVACL